jgi:hypothetical protein
MPGNPSARLFRVELAISDGRYADADAEAPDVLRAAAGDESTIEWSLNLLTDSWKKGSPGKSHAAALAEFSESLAQSPSFQICLAREKSKP